MSGVYQIINAINGKSYIGSAINIAKRKKEHFSLLRRNTHHNNHLQHSFNLYGQDAFIFNILEYCEKEDLVGREQFWLDSYKCQNSGLYNIYPIAYSPLGTKRSVEARKKTSQALKGRTIPEVTKQKLAEANRGKCLSDETKKKISEALAGRKRPPFSEEWKQKISKSSKGKIISDETRRRMSMARTGTHRSKETKEKMSMAQKGRIVSEEARVKISETLKKFYAEKRGTI